MQFQGKFITFEGGEGGGKSTQAKLLERALTHANILSVTTREPGGTPQAEKIRELLVTTVPNAPRLDPVTEVFLHMAARREHLTHVIYSQLERDVYVISDRFMDSTRVFQGDAMGVSETLLDDLYWIIAKDFQPDVTFILDLPPEEGLKRSLQHNASIGSHEDRYEKLGLEFHRKVRAGFNRIAHKYPERCVVIDATQSMLDVHQAIIAEMNKRFHLNINSVPFVEENTPAPVYKKG